MCTFLDWLITTYGALFSLLPRISWKSFDQPNDFLKIRESRGKVRTLRRKFLDFTTVTGRKNSESRVNLNFYVFLCKALCVFDSLI